MRFLVNLLILFSNVLKAGPSDTAVVSDRLNQQLTTGPGSPRSPLAPLIPGPPC